MIREMLSWVYTILSNSPHLSTHMFDSLLKSFMPSGQKHPSVVKFIWFSPGLWHKKGLNGWVCSPSASIKKDYWQTHSDVGYVISIWSNQSLIDNGIDWQWHGRLFIDCYWSICSTVNQCFNEIVLVFTGLLLCRTTWFIDFVCWAVTGCVGKKRETISGKAS